MEIGPEQPGRDADAIEALYDRTFGPGHFAKTAERLREGSLSLPAVSRVARLGDAVIGVCRVWPIRVGADRALFYGPVAVDPGHQGQALGLTVTAKALAAAKETAKEADWAAAVLIGAPAYFSRIGFEPVPAGQLVFPGPQDAARVMAISLARPWQALAGLVRADPAQAVPVGLANGAGPTLARPPKLGRDTFAR